MTVCRTVKKGVFIDTNIDCQNCDSVKRICTWDGECENLEPMTNEEYIHSLNTEQLADFIADVCYELIDDVWSNDGDTSCDYRETEKNYWVEWLKQPHTNE